MRPGGQRQVAGMQKQYASTRWKKYEQVDSKKDIHIYIYIYIDIYETDLPESFLEKRKMNTPNKLWILVMLLPQPFF